MAITINAKGTSHANFTIGKQGTTLHQGTTTPAAALEGDVWIDPISTSIKMYKTGAFIAMNSGDLSMSASTITPGAGTLYVTGAISATGNITAGTLVLNDAQNTLRKSDTGSFLNLSGGNTTANGGNIMLYGATHATLAGDIKLRSNSTDILHYDASADSVIIAANTLTTTGTINGRNISTDGTKLDTIESNATADQTGAEIKVLYENELDTNAFTDVNVTSLANAIQNSEKAAPNGVSTLDATGTIPVAQLPAVSITDTSVVATEAAMLLLVAQTGDVAVRTDTNTSYILQGADPTILGDWQELLTPVSDVTSVDGQSGIVTLSGVYEPLFAKSTGFNLNLGSSAGTVSEGTHNHTGVYLPIGSTAADSSLLDGLDSLQFLRSDTSGTLNGSLAISTGTLSVSGTSATPLTLHRTSVDSNTNMRLQGLTSDIYFGITGAAGELRVGPSADLGTTGDTIYHSGNFVAGTDFQAVGTYNTVIGTSTDINNTGAMIVDNIFVTDGVITNMGSRTLAAADIGAAATVHEHASLHYLGTAKATATATGLAVVGIVDASSDRNLKKNISTYTGTAADATATDIRAVTFNWKDETLGTQLVTGYIAQEVEEVLPDAVRTNEAGIKSVNYDAVHTAKIAELESKIDDQAEQIQALMAMVLQLTNAAL